MSLDEFMFNKTNTKLNKILVVAVFAVAASIVLSGTVYADNNENYGGGETHDRDFDIKKEVSKEKDGDYDKKITGVKEGRKVYFRITVRNTGNVDSDEMKYEDFLPDEMVRVGEDGLTEEWDNFDAGEKKTFIIAAKVKDSEYDDDDFDKCVYNKVKLYHDGDYQDSSSAAVCYSNTEAKELPKTGAETNVLAMVSGLGLTLAGFAIKKSRR